MSALVPYVGPFLALLGTLVVAAISFYQWRRTASNQSRSAIADGRRKAAEALWSKLEWANTTWPVTREPGEIAKALAEAEQRRSDVKRILLESAGA